MSHDDARHMAPLSPPPTLLVETKELPSSGWDKGMEHVVEHWTYEDGLEDGGAPAPPFPPVRDDSGFEEFNAQDGFADGRKAGDSYGDHVMIEPTAAWSCHSPLSMDDEGLPLADLRPLHDGVLDSGRHDSLFQPMAFSRSTDHLGRWGSEPEMNWPASPGSTIYDDSPPSPKPSALSLDLPSLCSPLEFDPHGLPQPQLSLMSPLDFPYHQSNHGWYDGEDLGDSSAHATVEQPHSFFTSFSHIPLHPPSDEVDLESDYSDTVMPSEDEDSMQTLPLNLPEPPSSPHSPNLLLPELEDEEMQSPPPEVHNWAAKTISPSLLGGAPAPEQEGLGLFLQTLSVDPPFVRSPSPDEEELQLPDVQLDPASTILEVDEYLQLQALRKQALQQERAARLAESELNDRARRVRKQQKRRSKEIGALLDLKMQVPFSPVQGVPPNGGGGKSWTRSLAHLVANMVLRRHDRSRPLESRTSFDPEMRRESFLRRSLSADDLLSMSVDDDDHGGGDVDYDMEE
ncbi:hypothetical protein C2E23DRAFT_720054 [Lenzites betulinus]|nr:hypothetical protein C2E23DRAFT_720054 [Lenzites betulinus]